MGCTPAILIGKMMIHQQKVGLGVPGDGVLVVPIIDNKAGWTMLWSGRWSDYYKVVTLTKNIGFRGISWDWTRWFWMILDDFRLFEISSRLFKNWWDKSWSLLDAEATEPELVPELLRVLEKYPMAPAVLVREPWMTWEFRYLGNGQENMIQHVDITSKHAG